MTSSWSAHAHDTVTVIGAQKIPFVVQCIFYQLPMKRNSLAAEVYVSYIKNLFLKLILQIDIVSTSREIGLTWVPLNLIDDKSTLAQVMACCQATSHYLTPCWSSSVPPCGVTRPQCVNMYQNKIHRPQSSNHNTIQYNTMLHAAVQLQLRTSIRVLAHQIP